MRVPKLLLPSDEHRKYRKNFDIRKIFIKICADIYEKNSKIEQQIRLSFQIGLKNAYIVSKEELLRIIGD